MASTADPLTAGRNFGVPEGRTERIERMVRRIYPDGTVVDSEPVEVGQSDVSLTWSSLAGLFARSTAPKGTKTKVFNRRVVIEAEPWAEVVPEDPQHGAA